MSKSNKKVEVSSVQQQSDELCEKLKLVHLKKDGSINKSAIIREMLSDDRKFTQGCIARSLHIIPQFVSNISRSMLYSEE